MSLLSVLLERKPGKGGAVGAGCGLAAPAGAAAPASGAEAEPAETTGAWLRGDSKARTRPLGLLAVGRGCTLPSTVNTSVVFS